MTDAPIPAPDENCPALTFKQIIKAYWVVLQAPLLLLAPLLARGQVIFWGTPALQFIPWWTYATESLRAGSLPLWNLLNGMGAPLLANYQLGFFYPPNWLILPFALLGRGAGAAWALTLLTILHLAFAGLGMALLIRRLGFPWLAQVIGGLAFGLSGYVIARLQFFPMIWAAAWMPWVIFTASRDWRSQSRDAVIPLIACLAMLLLAGHAQLAWYTILLAGAWVTFWAWKRGGIKRIPAAWLWLVTAGLIAAAIAAVQLVPTFEFLRASSRADAYAYQDAVNYSFWPWRFLTIFSPDLFGSPASGDFWGYATYWEDHLYAGMIPLLLALATLWLLVRGIRRSRRVPRWGLIVFLWALMVVTFVLAMGKFTPVFPFFYNHIPTFTMFQAPARFLIWAAFALPLLAAVGIERWRCPTGRGLYWFRLGTAGAFAITLGAGLALIFMQNIRLTFIRATALTGLWSLGAGLLTLAIPLADKWGRRGWWRGAAIAWTLVDLLFVGWSLNPGFSAALFAGTPAPDAALDPVNSSMRVFLSKREEYDLKYRRFFRFKAFQPLEAWQNLRVVMPSNLNLLDGVPSANNFDPLASARYNRFMQTIETLSPTQQRKWLALIGVSYVEHIDASQPSGVRFDPVDDAARWHWFACAQPAADEAAAWQEIDRRIAENMDPLQAPLIVETDSPGKCSTAGAPAQITLASERPDSLSLKVNALSDGWLMLADTYYPGWQATVDGVPVPIYPAYGLFRGVKIVAGTHEIRFRYHPSGFYFGVMSSILAVLFVIFISIPRRNRFLIPSFRR